MWLIFTTWLKANLKWILSALAVLLVIAVFIFMLHKLKNAGREIGQLTANLAAEREVRTALEADYQALVKVLEQEKQEAEDTAAAANKITKDITDASDQDRPAGPVLRRTIDSLRNASTATN
ncbi:MAG: twin-arginine translocase TatA/TatE family subunit [Rhodospirillales bacterium]|nr:twin-arginine translocase TatA/TatE family subunit [Rhodospirillales bacterium]MCB9994806.1 twin-arginine translocase TatA/TatE family subunit [Rhodospirillales bacterium]